MATTELLTKRFDELTTAELYDLLALRTDIFVVEQNCPYPELDGHDQVARHIMFLMDGKLLGYARILPPNSVYTQPSIGRVAVRMAYRGKGVARALVKEALRIMESEYPGLDFKLQAQTYLEDFYAGFGFKRMSDPYPDFGIMHVDMILNRG